MKLIVNPHKIEIEKSPVNEKEINITKVEFEFSEEITENYVKEAYFTLNGNSYKQIIINNQCDIPYEVLNKQGQVEIGVVAYLVENEEEIKRYNPSPVYISTLIGSLKEEFENSEPVTPSDKEQMEQQLLNISTQMDNLDIDAEKEEHTTTITITKKDGTTKEVEVLDGEKGEKGDKGEPGAIQMIIVNELPQTGQEDTIYLVPYTTIIVQELPSTGNTDTIYIVESTNKRYVYESGQWLEITDDNKYIEYIYVNNKWEKLGGINVDIDLSNYYTKQEVNNLIPDELADLRDDSTHRLVTDTEKSTWNNKYAKPSGGIPKSDLASDVQTSLGKADTALQSADLTDYVKNTDYATSSVGGVIKTSWNYGTRVTEGFLNAQIYDYTNYQSASNSIIIGKGTLENVLNARIGDISNAIDLINGESI